MEQKWNLEDVIWELLPETLKIGVKSITPETINPLTAEDLRSFIQVFTGRPICPAPSIVQYSVSSGTGSLSAGTYVYRFTAATEYDDGSLTGESISGDYVVVEVSNPSSSVEWTIQNYISTRATGFKIYRSDPVPTPPVGDLPTPYGDIETPLRYIVTSIPATYIDDGTDPDYDTIYPPEQTSAYYDPEMLDKSYTLDEMRNKIRQLGEMINLSIAPEKVLPYLFHFLRSLINPAKDIEEQVDEFKKRVDVLKIKTTIPSILRTLKQKRRELGITTGETLDEVYEPYVHIAKYSHSALSGTEVFSNPGNRTFSSSGTLHSTDPTILEDLSSPIFSTAKEGHVILMPDEGGSRKGFKIAKVIDNNHVEIPQASLVWNDPVHRGKTDITNIRYFLYVPEPESHHFTDWKYWHHGVYEVRTTLNPSEFKDELLDNVHPAGTRVYFAFLLTSFLCEDDVDVDDIVWDDWMLSATTVERGSGDQDEITEPYFRKIKTALSINVGGVWNVETLSFEGGTEYVRGTDWEFVADDSSFPTMRYYIDWSVGGSAPSLGEEYTIIYIDCKAYFGHIPAAELGIVVEPEVKYQLCGIVPSVGPPLSGSGATLSGCIEVLEEIGIYIDMGSIEGLPALMRRTPGWSATLQYPDLNGTIGYLCGSDSPDPYTDCWVTDGYRYDSEPPYLDAQGPDDINLLIFTVSGSSTNPSITKGAAGGQDEFVPHQDKLVTAVLEVNQGGTWNKTTHTFTGGTSYLEHTDWELVIDDTVYPHKFYIDWSPGGSEPVTATTYDMAYTLKG